MPSIESDDSPAKIATATPPYDDPLAELREVLFGREQDQLAHLHEQFNDPEALANAVSRILPDAIKRRDARDGNLADSLAPLVEKGLQRSIRQNPAPLIDILFPIIGPAIRKAVVVSIQSMVQTINQTLESSFSPKALKWRWEALRSGRPFAEIVLKHSLIYRVEQAFLIHRESGLLLVHVADTVSVVRDEDMVSGMLTAIREFVKDSFAFEGDEGLQTVQVGDLTVWVEQSPYVVLALVLRGSPQESLKGRMQEVLEAVHERHADQLRSFDGDSTGFAASADLLRGCLSSNGPKPAATRKSRPWIARIAIALVATMLGVWVISSSIRSSRRAADWAECVDRLGRHPGIVVIQSGTRDGKYFIFLLRDPVADEPSAIIAKTAVRPAEVIVEERPFLSLDPEIEARRRR